MSFTSAHTLPNPLTTLTLPQNALFYDVSFGDAPDRPKVPCRGHSARRAMTRGLHRVTIRMVTLHYLGAVCSRRDNPREGPLAGLLAQLWVLISRFCNHDRFCGSVWGEFAAEVST